MKQQLPDKNSIYKLFPGEDLLDIVYNVCSEKLVADLVLELQALIDQKEPEFIENENDEIRKIVSDRSIDDPMKIAVDTVPDIPDSDI